MTLDYGRIREALAYYAPIRGSSPHLDALYEAAKTVVPKTKTETRWHVYHANRIETVGRSVWVPAIDLRSSEANAHEVANSMRARPHQYQCVYVTGPHGHEVPSD